MIDIDQLALDTTEKVYAVDPAKLRGGHTQAKAIIQCLIYAAIQAAITRQANAARRGMDAAKEAGAHMEAEARRLYAECNPEALESERAANAQLTEDLQRTEAERDGWVESARHFANGQEFYQGLVRQVGNLFGEVAYTSDDGSVQDDVLALKVPELVEALASPDVSGLVEALEAACEYLPIGSRALGLASIALAAHRKQESSHDNQ